MLFAAKILLSAFVIAFASWYSGRNSFLAGFVVALPLASILSILFSYFQYRNMEKINEFALSILVSVPLSLLFFVPFVLNRWLKLNFTISFCAGIILLFAAF